MVAAASLAKDWSSPSPRRLVLKKTQPAARIGHKPSALVVGPDARWVCLGDLRIDLERRDAPRRILMRLCEHVAERERGADHGTPRDTASEPDQVSECEQGVACEPPSPCGESAGERVTSGEPCEPSESNEDTACENAAARPSETLSVGPLFAAGWPGQRIRYESRVKRVHTAIWQLRKLGLASVLVTDGRGYRLTVPVQMA